MNVLLFGNKNQILVGKVFFPTWLLCSKTHSERYDFRSTAKPDYQIIKSRKILTKYVKLIIFLLVHWVLKVFQYAEAIWNHSWTLVHSTTPRKFLNISKSNNPARKLVLPNLDSHFNCDGIHNYSGTVRWFYARRQWIVLRNWHHFEPVSFTSASIVF